MNGSMNDKPYSFGGYRDHVLVLLVVNRFFLLVIAGTKFEIASFTTVSRTMVCGLWFWFVTARIIVQDLYNEVVEVFTLVPLEVGSRRLKKLRSNVL
jgi:hypothetical protein